MYACLLAGKHLKNHLAQLDAQVHETHDYIYSLLAQITEKVIWLIGMHMLPIHTCSYS